MGSFANNSKYTFHLLLLPFEEYLLRAIQLFTPHRTWMCDYDPGPVHIHTHLEATESQPTTTTSTYRGRQGGNFIFTQNGLVLSASLPVYREHEHHRAGATREQVRYGELVAAGSGDFQFVWILALSYRIFPQLKLDLRFVFPSFAVVKSHRDWKLPCHAEANCSWQFPNPVDSHQFVFTIFPRYGIEASLVDISKWRWNWSFSCRHFRLN